MKNPTLSYLLATIAPSVATVLLPICAFAAPQILFESDFQSGTIFKFTPDGTRTTFATGLSSPIGLAFSASGNLLVSDPNSGTIFKFTPTGAETTFTSGLDVPTALAFDSFADLFEASGNDGSIFVFTPGGTPTSIFASGLSGPAGLAFQPATLPPAPPAQLLNISARLKVLTGDNVLIGGFIITGSDNKQVLLRALGP